MAAKKINGTLSMGEYLDRIGKDDKRTIINLEHNHPIDFIPTGSWIIDYIIGDGTLSKKPGGFPRGHTVEILGDEASGKTTLLLSALLQVQKMGYPAILIDYERKFTPYYAKNLGLDLSKEKFLLCRPDHFQQGGRQIRDMLNMKPPMIAVDSVSAMTPREYTEGLVDDTLRIGLQAQLMSTFLGYITKFIGEYNTSLVFTNQLRSVIKPSVYTPGPTEESSGGRALRYYSSLRILLKKSTVERISTKSMLTGKEEKEPVNITIKVTAIKNSIDIPYKTAPVYIRFGQGFDNIKSLMELAINTKLIAKSGSIYTFRQNNETIFKVKGKEELWNTLNNNETTFDTLRSAVSQVITEDTKLKEYYEEQEKNEDDEMEALLDNVSNTFIEKANRKKNDQDNN